MNPWLWALAILGVLIAANIVGIALARVAARRRPTGPADVQAIQDAPAVEYFPLNLDPPGRDRGMEAPCLLTPAEVDTFADIAAQLGSPDWERLAGLYLIPEETS